MALKRANTSCNSTMASWGSHTRRPPWQGLHLLGIAAGLFAVTASFGAISLDSVPTEEARTGVLNTGCEVLERHCAAERLALNSTETHESTISSRLFFPLKKKGSGSR